MRQQLIVGVAMTTGRLFLIRATNQFLFCCRPRGGGLHVRMVGTDGRGWRAGAGAKGRKKRRRSVGNKEHQKLHRGFISTPPPPANINRRRTGRCREQNQLFLQHQKNTVGTSLIWIQTRMIRLNLTSKPCPINICYWLGDWLIHFNWSTNQNLLND